MLNPDFSIIVTPEKLCSPEFMKLLEPLYCRGELNRLVVDEVRWTHTHFPASINYIRHIVYPCVAGLLNFPAHRV